jgi:hypothetical protein
MSRGCSAPSSASPSSSPATIRRLYAVPIRRFDLDGDEREGPSYLRCFRRESRSWLVRPLRPASSAASAGR